MRAMTIEIVPVASRAAFRRLRAVGDYDGHIVPHQLRTKLAQAFELALHRDTSKAMFCPSI